MFHIGSAVGTLVVLLLFLFSLAMDDGDFDHGGGSGRRWWPGGSSSGGNGQQLVAKAAGNKSIDGCMMACNDDNRW